MRSKPQWWFGVSLLGLAGCPLAPPTVEILDGDKVVNDGVVEVRMGESKTLVARGERVSRFIWIAEYDAARTDWVGPSFTDSFPFAGDYKITVEGERREWWTTVLSLPVSTTVRVGSGSPIADLPDIVFNLDGLVIGGDALVLFDGTIPLVSGGRIVLDATHFITGGTPPFTLIWQVAGVEIGRGMKLVWVPDRSGPITITLVVTDAAGRSATRLIVIVVTAPTPPPPPAPTVDLKVADQNGPLEFTAGASNLVTLKASWGSADATTLTASVTPAVSAFAGLLTEKNGSIDLVLASGTYVLRLDATGAGGTAFDTVTVTIKPFVPTPSQLVITGVVFSAPVHPPHHRVGELTAITITHTGGGVIHHLLATSTVVGGITAEADGSTSFQYTWPFSTQVKPVTGEVPKSFFWPDDRDFPPHRWSIDTIVDRP